MTPAEILVYAGVPNFVQSIINYIKKYYLLV